MSNLTKKDIQHLAGLARLELSPEETERYAEQLTTVVSYVDQLTNVATGEAGSEGVTGLSNVLQEDVPRGSESLANLNPAEALAGAPLSEGGNLVVRAVMNASDTEAA
jgi:aspartyl-tRNA(Asn)/glutamyl-tRNA(Gln) amidotransferase subunit C